MKVLVCHRLHPALTEKLKARIKNHELIFASNEEEAMKYVEDADVMIGMRISGKLIRACKKLKLVHAISAGVDGIDLEAIRESGAYLCRARGAYSTPVSEHALALMLLWELKLLKQIERAKEWKTVFHGELKGKTLGILGYGDIGREIAIKAKAFGMRVIAVKRSEAGSKDEVVDFLGTIENLDYLLKESDFLVIALPLTKETYHLIGERELRLMKPSSVLVNISRGGIVDESALIKALKEKWIAGALLDVLEKEPPDKDNPLLSMENVIITPHDSGITEKAFERVADIIQENLNRLERGERLLFSVDLEKGY